MFSKKKCAETHFENIVSICCEEIFEKKQKLCDFLTVENHENCKKHEKTVIFSSVFFKYLWNGFRKFKKTSDLNDSDHDDFNEPSVDLFR